MFVKLSCVISRCAFRWRPRPSPALPRPSPPLPARGSPVTPSGRKTSAGTASSRRSYPPGRGQRRCAAGAYWLGQTLLTQRGDKERSEGRRQSKRLSQVQYETEREEKIMLVSFFLFNADRTKRGVGG